jgi:hypothetical protein
VVVFTVVEDISPIYKWHSTMTEVYDDPKKFDGKLKPYPHEEFGTEVRKRSDMGSDTCRQATCCTVLSSCVPCSSLLSRMDLYLYVLLGSSQPLLFAPFRTSKNPFQRGRASDPVAYLHDVEQRARERQVAYETVRLLRQRVRQQPTKDPEIMFD